MKTALKLRQDCTIRFAQCELSDTPFNLAAPSHVAVISALKNLSCKLRFSMSRLQLSEKLQVHHQAFC